MLNKALYRKSINTIVIMCLFLQMLCISSCKKLNELTKFNIEFHQDLKINSGANLNLPFNILTPDITTNSEYTFDVNDTRKDLINEIKLSTLELNLKSPSNSDFGFLKSISIYINAQDLPELKLAWKDNIPDEIDKQLILDVSGEDFKEYIKKDEFSIRVNTTTDEAINNDHIIDIYSVYRVDAKRKSK